MAESKDDKDKASPSGDRRGSKDREDRRQNLMDVDLDHQRRKAARRSEKERRTSGKRPH